MIIHGLQKLTLLDFPGRVACTVFLGGCDFRCPFCHNSELLDMNAPALMDDGELLRFLKTRQGLLDGVCFTGGEPLMRKDLPELLRSVKALGYAVKLDTNGYRPDALKALIDEGLIDYAAMDIKNSPARYAETAGRPGLDFAPVCRSIEILKEGRIPYEFRTTVVAEFHSAEDFPSIGELIKGAEHYYLQCFTDRDSVLRSGLTAPSKADLEHYKELVLPFVKAADIRGVD